MTLIGTYPGLFVPEGDRKRGKTHCRRCGGRTRARDEGAAVHDACTTTGKKSGAKR